MFPSALCSPRELKLQFVRSKAFCLTPATFPVNIGRVRIRGDGIVSVEASSKHVVQ